METNDHLRCFISYAWESEEHQEWVRTLAVNLQNSSIYTYLDQWDVHPGQDLQEYMEYAIRSSNYVLLVCTPKYASKADKGEGGVGYEKSIVTGEIFTANREVLKFIPLLREGEPIGSLPSFLKSKVFIDFRKDEQYDKSFEELIRHIYAKPRIERPPLGQKPAFVIPSEFNIETITELQANTLKFRVENIIYEFQLPSWWESVQVDIPEDNDKVHSYIITKWGKDTGTRQTWKQALKSWALYYLRNPGLPVYIAHCYSSGGQNAEAARVFTELYELARLLSKKQSWFLCYLAYEAGKEYLALGQQSLAYLWYKKSAKFKNDKDDTIRYYASRSEASFMELEKGLNLTSGP